MAYEFLYAPPHVDGGAELLAIVIGANQPIKPGAEFLTPPDMPMQLACIGHPAGHKVRPHVHLDVNRTFSRTQEVLYVRKGKAQLDLFTADGEPAGSRILAAGDLVMLVAGGHGLTVLEEVEIVEIKGGPYLGRERDKKSLIQEQGEH